MTGLITKTRQAVVYTGRCDYDSTLALCKGLEEYLATCTRTHAGRLYRFETTGVGWADPEEGVSLPAFNVRPNGRVAYSEAKPTVVARLSNGDSVVKYEEAQAPLAVMVYAQRVAELSQVVKLVEDAFNAVDWRNGVLLRLDHYYGVHASYRLDANLYDLSPETTSRGFAKTTIEVFADVEVCRLKAFPKAVPEVDSTIT